MEVTETAGLRVSACVEASVEFSVVSGAVVATASRAVVVSEAFVVASSLPLFVLQPANKSMHAHKMSDTAATIVFFIFLPSLFLFFESLFVQFIIL